MYATSDRHKNLNYANHGHNVNNIHRMLRNVYVARVFILPKNFHFLTFDNFDANA